MCLPVRCDERSVSGIFPVLSFFLEKTFGILISNNSTVECFKQKDSFFNKLSIPQWTVLVIFAFLILLVLYGTSIDMYRKRRNRKYSFNKGSLTSVFYFFNLSFLEKNHPVNLSVNSYFWNLEKELTVTAGWQLINSPLEELLENSLDILDRAFRNCIFHHMTARLAKNVSSNVSSICMPCIQDDARSFIYSDAPSQALTYKSVPAVQRTLKKPSFIINSVAVGHVHLFSLEYIGNVRQLWSSLKANEKLSQIIFNSSLSVDSFLLISATVLAYKVHLRVIQQKKHQRKRIALSPSGWLILWLHRFMRLTPAYLATLLIIYFIFQHIGDGPMWSQQNGIFGARCNKDDIWRQLFFVSNFYPNECMPWMWYLALDTQFYMVAPIALLLLHAIPTVAIPLIVIVVISSVIYRATALILFRFPTTFVSALLEDSSLETEEMEKMFRYLYAVPQARIGPFLIGNLKSNTFHSVFHLSSLNQLCLLQKEFVILNSIGS
uniref:Acyl_transf_3 domain-containing protein n=1 Tax=Loa loa TaxID=7209 RepID=A0A1I7VQX6_LOALO